MTSISLFKTEVQVLFFRNAAKLYGEEGPCPATEHAAGIDLRACLTNGPHLHIPPGERRSVPSGIAVAPTLPGMAGFVYSRSGLGAVKGITVAQGVGVIDPDYRGEILVFLLNTGPENYTVQQGERIAQLIFQPFVRAIFRPVTSLDETSRGVGGFGHTGTG